MVVCAPTDKRQKTPFARQKVSASHRQVPIEQYYCTCILGIHQTLRGGSIAGQASLLIFELFKSRQCQESVGLESLVAISPTPTLSLCLRGAREP